MNVINKMETVKHNITDLMNNYPEYQKHPNKKPEYNNQDLVKVRLIIKELALKQEKEIPIFIQECRSYDEVVNNIFQENQEFEVLLNYVTSIFNLYIDLIEEERLDIKIEYVGFEIPKELTFRNIIEYIEKCQYRIDMNDYSGAVTSAKTLVESVCKEILHKFSEDVEDLNISLPRLLTKVRKRLNLDPSDPQLDKSLKEVISGLIQIVNGLSEVRNQRGDSHLAKYSIDRHHALFVVNAAKTVITFLFNTYEYQLKNGQIKHFVKD